MQGLSYRFSMTLCLDTGLNTLHSYVRYLLVMRCYSVMDVVVDTRFHSVVLSNVRYPCSHNRVQT